jgi:hypothetical protein
MTTPWSWGVEPLPEQRHFAEYVRSVISLVLSVEHADSILKELVEALVQARDGLAAIVPESSVPRVGKDADGAGRVYLDHCLDIGVFNPMFPRHVFTSVDTSCARGTVNFPLCYEGAPGLVNGGFLGVFFDGVMSEHNTRVGQAGHTRNLDIRFRRPTPLLVDLDFEVVRTVDERSVHSEVRLQRRGEVLATATSAAVRLDQPRVSDFSSRRASSARSARVAPVEHDRSRGRRPRG